MTLSAAALRLQTIPIGSRVVVRFRIEGGLTDALGYLTEISEDTCTVRTRTGDATIALKLVQAAKPVPPPPPRR